MVVSFKLAGVCEPEVSYDRPRCVRNKSTRGYFPRHTKLLALRVFVLLKKLKAL